MSKFRFREYDALGLRKRVPGDDAPSANHISKHKLKQKGLEVTFDNKDYKDYVTGFRKRKQQRRQDAQKHIKQKDRQERNQQRSEKRTKLREELGLAADYGVSSSGSEDEADRAAAKPQSVTVYEGDGGTTTTTVVTTLVMNASDDELPGGSDEEEGEREEQAGENEEEAAEGGKGFGRQRGGAAEKGAHRPGHRKQQQAGKRSRGQLDAGGKGGRGGSKARPGSGKADVSGHKKKKAKH